LLQDDITKFVSNLTPPPRLADVPEEGQSKVKERREIGEEDGETLQERFQLRSRFSRPGLPHVPLVDDPPTSLEASIPVPPRRPLNVARMRITKKLR
jgi:hypothetical protein